MDNQLYPYFDNICSTLQCSFRKGYNAQHCLMFMIEKWRRSLNESGHARAFLNDPFKAFDCLNHDLLTAKLNAYGVDRAAVFYVLTSKTENKERKLTHYIVDLVKLVLVLQKDLFWVLFYSIYKYAIRSMKVEIWILLVRCSQELNDILKI